MPSLPGSPFRHRRTRKAMADTVMDLSDADLLLPFDVPAHRDMRTFDAINDLRDTQISGNAA